MTSTTIHTPRIIMMMDIETLGKRATAVAWQTALFAVESTDPETILDRPHHAYLPIQPQLDLNRVIDGDTMLFWMKPEQDAARQGMVTECDSEDFDELVAALRHFNRAFERYADQAQGDWELWTRGNFDAPIMESLLRQCGLPCHWSNEFRKLRDLRTFEAIAGVSYKDVQPQPGFIKHRADHDAVFQLTHLAALNKALGADKV